MKTNILTVICLAFVIFMTSCNSGSKKETPITDVPPMDHIEMGTTGDNSMTSLDWAGTYNGELPCADCEGIKTKVTINSDNTYTIQETYLGKETAPNKTEGTFEWDDQGQRILLSGDRNAFFVGENTLTLLDNDGNKITGDLEALYVLRKEID